MRVRPQRHLLHPPQQLPKALRRTHLRAQHQSVDEKADQSLGLAVRATGYRGAHQHIRLPAQPVQQRLKGRQQHHEQRRLLPARQLQQLPGQLLR